MISRGIPGMMAVSVFTGVGRSFIRVFESIVGTVDGSWVLFTSFPARHSCEVECFALEVVEPIQAVSTSSVVGEMTRIRRFFLFGARSAGWLAFKRPRAEADYVVVLDTKPCVLFWDTPRRTRFPIERISLPTTSAQNGPRVVPAMVKERHGVGV